MAKTPPQPATTTTARAKDSRSGSKEPPFTGRASPGRMAFDDRMLRAEQIEGCQESSPDVGGPDFMMELRAPDGAVRAHQFFDADTHISPCHVSRIAGPGCGSPQDAAGPRHRQRRRPS